LATERRRKMWQDFNYGVEFMLLVSFLKTASREATEDALASLDKLISQCSASIVQATCGKADMISILVALLLSFFSKENLKERNCFYVVLFCTRLLFGSSG
jgi:hypothetical protein